MGTIDEIKVTIGHCRGCVGDPSCLVDAVEEILEADQELYEPEYQITKAEVEHFRNLSYLTPEEFAGADNVIKQVHKVLYSYLRGGISLIGLRIGLAECAEEIGILEIELHNVKAVSKWVNREGSNA